jgi:hypothetical protein
VKKMDGNAVEGCICDRCGSTKVAVAMDVGFVEVFCPVCELGMEMSEWR